MPLLKEKNSPARENKKATRKASQELRHILAEWLICFGVQKRDTWPLIRLKPFPIYNPNRRKLSN